MVGKADSGRPHRLHGMIILSMMRLSSIVADEILNLFNELKKLAPKK